MSGEIESTMSTAPPEVSILDSLPNELLDIILSYLSPATSATRSYEALYGLHSISVSSRRLSIVAQRHLYSSVSVTVNWSYEYVSMKDLPLAVFKAGFSIPTTVACNATAFLRTISSRPDLARYVRTLRIDREDSGFRSRWYAGFYGYRDDSPYKPVIGAWRFFQRFQLKTLNSIKRVPSQRSMDPESTTISHILLHLHNLSDLDLSKYHTDSPYDLFKWSNFPRDATYLLTMVTTVDINLHGRTLNNTWMWFGLPQIQHLTLSHGTVGVWNSILTSEWKGFHAPKLKILELPDLFLCGHWSYSDSYFSVVLDAAPALESIAIHWVTRRSLPSVWSQTYFAFLIDLYNTSVLKDLKLKNMGGVQERNLPMYRRQSPGADETVEQMVKAMRMQ